MSVKLRPTKKKRRLTRRAELYPGFCPPKACRPFICATYSALTYGPYIGIFGLAPSGVYLAAGVAVCAVSSCLTISPLPLRAVFFLLHFPSNGDIAPPSRAFARRSALGVRKFLRIKRRPAVQLYIFYKLFRSKSSSCLGSLAVFFTLEAFGLGAFLVSGSSREAK